MDILFPDLLGYEGRVDNDVVEFVVQRFVDAAVYFVEIEIYKAWVVLPLVIDLAKKTKYIC